MPISHTVQYVPTHVIENDLDDGVSKFGLLRSGGWERVKCVH